MKHLLRTYPDQFLGDLQDLIEILLGKINHAGEDIVELAVEVLAIISNYQNYYDKIIDKVIHMFYLKRDMIKNKGPVIIRKLSSSLKPERLFVTLAQNLLKFEVSY